jgi:VIT1/CCC1 family predicted Fe2+/Mn2+ transporter
MSNYLSRRSELDYQKSRAGEGNPNVDSTDAKSPKRTAFVTFLAFIVAEWAPLIPYILELGSTFPLANAFTQFAFFTVGASRSLVTTRQWYINGVEMFVGMAAAGVAFSVGKLLGGFVWNTVPSTAPNTR